MKEKDPKMTKTKTLFKNQIFNVFILFLLSTRPFRRDNCCFPKEKKSQLETENDI